MRNHFLRAAAIKPFTISFVTQATVQIGSITSTTTSITIPATVQANDIIVVQVFPGTSDFATPRTITTPTNYILINYVGAGNTLVADADSSGLYYKVAVSGDAGATLTVTHESANFRSINLQVFRTTLNRAPNVNIKNVYSYGVTTLVLNAANPPSTVITSGSGTPPLIAFAADGGVATRTLSPTADGTTTTFNRNLSYKIYNTAPANISYSATTTARNVLTQTFYMEIS
jgi:hypothetical protein